MNRGVLAVALALVAGGCGSDSEAEAPGAGGAGVGGSAGSSGTGGSAGTGGGVGGSGGGPASPLECASPDADWVFCSDFEEGNKDVWDDYDGNPDSTNLLMSDPGPFGLGDNHVMRLRVPPGRGGADLVKELPESYDKLYARWYVQFEPGFDFSAPNHGGGLHAGSRDLLGHSDTQPDGADWFSTWVDYRNDTPHVFNLYSYYRGMYQDCVDPNGSCWGDNFPCLVDEGATFCEKPQHRDGIVPPTLETGRWYCVEIMADGGTPTATESGANGTFDFWVDGAQIGPWNDLWLRTTPDLKINILWLNLFHHQEHSVEGILLDHVVVSKSRVGCL